MAQKLAGCCENMETLETPRISRRDSGERGGVPPLLCRCGLSSTDIQTPEKLARRQFQQNVLTTGLSIGDYILQNHVTIFKDVDCGGRFNSLSHQCFRKQTCNCNNYRSPSSKKEHWLALLLERMFQHS